MTYITSASSPSTVLWAFHTIQPSGLSLIVLTRYVVSATFKNSLTTTFTSIFKTYMSVQVHSVHICTESVKYTVLFCNMSFYCIAELYRARYCYSIFIWLKARLQPNIGFTLWQVLTVFMRSAITPTKVN